MKGKSMDMIEQIKRMHLAGHGIRKISESLQIARNTVRNYLRKDRSDEKKEKERMTSASTSLQAKKWSKTLAWDDVAQSLAKGVSLKQLYEEYEPPTSYSNFTRYVKSLRPKQQKVSPRISHQPGEKCQIDYADGLFITHPRTGKQKKTHFFCGVLPFSSLTYGEFVENQKLASFLSSHERMWAYFGGVTPYVVIDNLKAGVVKAHRYDPDINPTYCDYANHSGFAVLPARPRHPKDKAAVEAAIGVIQRSFYQKYRETSFYALSDLNQTFRKFLDPFNQQKMSEYGISRRERFEQEKPLLHPCPSSPYEIVEWKECKVHLDSCIQLQKALYSVPYLHVGQSLKVKFNDRMVVILNQEMEVIATHIKQPPGSRSIEQAHLPPSYIQLNSFSVQLAKKKASQIGPKTYQYVSSMLEGTHPLKYLRRVQGVLRLYEKAFSKESMEYAANQAINFSRFHFSYFQNCVEFYEKSSKQVQTCQAPKRDPLTSYIN